MNLFTLILRSLVHHRRRHAATAAGMAVATAVLTAALIVGDSVRISLRDLALARLGRVRYAVETGERRFRAALAGEVARETGFRAAALLAVQGSVSAPDTGLRAPHVRVVGADASFDALAETSPAIGSLAAGEAAVSSALAARLGVRPGDPLVLRLAKPGALPADIPLGSEDKPWVSVRVVVKGVLSDRQLGRFSLRASQLAPLTLFLPRDELASKLALPDRANLIVAAEPANRAAGDGGRLLGDALAKWRTLADHGLVFAPLTNGAGWELRSERVFLDDATAQAAAAAAPGAREIFTYFVNELRAGGRTCPYSMVSAPPPGADAAGDGMIVGAWLAEDLAVKPGDPVDVRYFALGAGRRLIETSRVFRVTAIAAGGGPADDPTLMPDFPGISDTERCGDWKPGIPVDLKRIRPKDEEYWNERRGTPKAFVGLGAAQAMWGNAFGRRTAIRWPATANGGAIAAALLARLPPAAAGLVVRDVREEGLQAGANGVDFAGLFIGLGFFIIVASLILAGLMLALSMETRAAEASLLRAVGFGRRRVRALLLGEAALVAAPGAIVGATAGIGATALVVGALRTVWQGAVGTSALTIHALPGTVAAGAAAGFAVALVTAALVLFRQSFRSIADVQAGPEPRPRRSRITLRFALATLALGGAAALSAASGHAGPAEAAGYFFAAGGLALIGGLAAMSGILARLAAAPQRARAPGVFGPRNWARRPRRTMAAVLMPACGLFLVLAVGVHRPETGGDPRIRASGTGGYALYGETALPLPHDPGTAEGRRFYGLADADLAGAQVERLRLREGDDASCLNLNRVTLPPVLGVPADVFAQRGAFRVSGPAGAPSPAWSVLDTTPTPDTIPAFGDATVIQWGLGKALGDRIPLTDEHGRRVELLLAGALSDSIFQGRLLISREAMERHFPSAEPRVLLADVPQASLDRARKALDDRLGDLGLDLQPAGERLAAFTVVQRTYLDIFLALGAIGLLIGSLGFGVAAHRNILERRREYAVLQALGWRRGRILRGAVLEHAGLAAAGLAIGAGAAALAVLPAGGTAAAAVGALAWLPAVLAATAAVSVYASVRAAMAASPLDALRDE